MLWWVVYFKPPFHGQFYQLLIGKSMQWFATLWPHPVIWFTFMRIGKFLGQVLFLTQVNWESYGRVFGRGFGMRCVSR
jgi:hypothetical protein